MTMKPRRRSGGEHVIPYALGGSFTIARVCLECDNRLGNIADAGLVNLSTVEQRRHELELAGQSGAIPDPEGRAEKKPFVAKSNPKHRVRRELDPKTGEPVLRTMSYVEFDIQEVDGGILIQPAHVYVDVSDRDKAEMLAKSALRKAGLKDDALVEQVARDFAAGLREVQSSQVFERTVEARVGGHEPGLLKIVYELAWFWLGDEWLHSEEAIALRETLARRTPPTPVRGKIYKGGEVALLAIGGDPRVVHVAWLYRFENHLIVFVRLFDVLTVGFVISQDASQYCFPERNAIIMQNVQRQYEEVTFAGEPGETVWEHDPGSSRLVYPSERCHQQVGVLSRAAAVQQPCNRGVRKGEDRTGTGRPSGIGKP